jgi:hypothetical protein
LSLDVLVERSAVAPTAAREEPRREAKITDLTDSVTDVTIITCDSDRELSVSEKVKVAMFLDANVAKALKMQSARQGDGISKIIHKVFSCAHCHEPIMDEFVVGTPKLVTGDKYGVFFHANRRDCLVASGTKIVFLPICLKCKNPAYQQFDRTTLYDLIKGNGVRFYCIMCDEHWPATRDDTVRLSHLLAAGVDGEVAACEAALEAAYRALEEGRRQNDPPEAMKIYHDRVADRRDALQRAREAASIDRD